MAKEMIIENKIFINRNINDVFEFLKQTKNQDKFSVWNMKDPIMQKTYTGVDGIKGFIYTWDSKDRNVGAGSQEIINVDEGKRIDYTLNFIRPMKNTAASSFILSKENESASSVEWRFAGPTKFPMSLFAPIFKKILGKQMSESLQNLKIILEKK